MSVQRAYAQRNTNLTKIVPEFTTRIENQGGPFFDLSGAAIYTLNLPNKFQNIGGVYYVDLSDVDTDGNLLDLSGQFVSTYYEGSGFRSLYTVNFAINAPFNPAYAPGLEFTIFFKNIPFDRIYESGNLPAPLFTIGMIDENGAPFPYIMSPPVPAITAPVSNSVTFKSDGTNYNIVSSGPAGWMGVANLALILGAATPIL